jgi:hypothetical protein
MGGCLNKIGLHGHPLDTDVRVLKEPRTVPYNRIGSLERIRTVSVPYRSVSRSKELEGFRGRLSPPTGYAELGRCNTTYGLTRRLRFPEFAPFNGMEPDLSFDTALTLFLRRFRD